MIDLKPTIRVIDFLAQQCYHIASDHGFHADHEQVTDLLQHSPVLPDADYQRIASWFESTCEQAEIARMHSELSEWLEGIRKNAKKPDNHLPEFLSAEVEAADAIIRILDTCGKRGYRIGAALVAKMEFNRGREYKHGKNS